jgi:hypothetical protein
MPETVVLSDEQISIINEAQARQRLDVQEFRRRADKLIERGRAEMGTEKFDQANRSLEGITPGAETALLNSDRPLEHIRRFSADKDEWAKFNAMPPQRQQQYLSGIESNSNSYGRASTSVMPAWLGTVAEDQASDGDWSSGAFQRECRDKQFHREFDRRMQEKSKRVR